jgi:hypothetical protein
MSQVWVEINNKLVNLDHVPLIEKRDIEEVANGKKVTVYYIEMTGIVKFSYHQDKKKRDEEYEKICIALVGPH